MTAASAKRNVAPSRREDLLPLTEAAGYLGVTKRWLARNIEAPPPIRMGRTTLWLKQELDRYIEAKRKECVALRWVP